MTRDVDSVPVSQASPLELLRMAWRLWRGRRENALVLAGYPWRPRRRAARVAFWIAVALAWVVSLGVLLLATWVAGGLGQAVTLDEVLYAFLFRGSISAIAVAFVASAALSLVAMLLASVLLVPAMAFRVPEGEGLAELRLPPMTNREAAFGSVYWGLWAYAAVLFPFWLVQGYLAVSLATAGARRYLDLDFAWLVACPAPLLLVHGSALAVAVSSYWNREALWGRTRDALWSMARGLLLTLLWIAPFVGIALAIENSQPDDYYSSPRYLGWTLLAFLTVSLPYACAVLWALCRRCLAFAGERLFAPVDPDALPVLWWRAADRATPVAHRWRWPEFSRRLFWVPAVWLAAALVSLLVATTTSRDRGLYRVTPGYGFAGTEIVVEVRLPLDEAMLIATPVRGEPASENPEDVTGPPGERSGSGTRLRLALPDARSVIRVEGHVVTPGNEVRRHADGSRWGTYRRPFGTPIYDWPPGHTPHLGTPLEALAARLFRLPVGVVITVLLAALIVPRGERVPARHAYHWAVLRVAPAMVPMALGSAATALAVMGPLVALERGVVAALIVVAGTAMAAAPVIALWVVSAVVAFHVAAARRRRRALGLCIAGAFAIAAAWNILLVPTPGALREDAIGASLLLLALCLVAVVPMMGGADSLRQRLHDEALQEVSP